MSATSTVKSSSSGERIATDRKANRLLMALGVLGAAVLAALLGLGLWPVPKDHPSDDATAGVSGGSNGLRQSFPMMIAPADNLPTNGKNAERVALGRLLFFDPIMSGDNETSCATCHHPDLGLSDGRAFSVGKGGHGLGPNRSNGAVTRRSSPSLWNAGYYHTQFWDGRARDLEEQAISPILSELEMGEDPARLLSELKQIPEYVESFDRAFEGAGSSSVSMENLAKALAAFERTLTANNSPFDRFAAGDRSALTEEQRRGFSIFRSGRTRCIECHGLPNFADRDFKAIGPVETAAQPDLGRYEITNRQSDKFAFKIPTLRNVVLTAPYMHNGSVKSLDEVIDFYSSGGSPRIGTPVDDKLRAFILTTEERKDLVAFLYSLTDESNLPAIPERVPSGLPVLPHIDNPDRQLVAKFNKSLAGEKGVARALHLVRVEAGQSIQIAIDKATPGDTIEVMPGLYNEQIIVDVDNLTLRGIAASDSADGRVPPGVPTDGSKRPLLDGKRKLSDGVIVSGSNFKLEGFDIKNYTANGVFGQYARNLALKDLRVEKTGFHGMHVINSSEVTIENVIANGMIDVGFYINSSRDTTVRECETFGNTVGVHIENCLGTAIEGNSVHDNTCGILISALPNNISTVAKDCRVTGNLISNNNSKNLGELSTLIGNLPNGAGILVLGADNTEVTANEIRGNVSYAVGVVGLFSFIDSTVRFDVGSIPENNWIHDNTYSDNGGSPAGSVLKAGLRGGDLVWDLSGWSNKWQEGEASKGTPVLDARWSAFARRVRWRLLNLM